MDTIEILEKVRQEVDGGWTKGEFIRYAPLNPRGYSVCTLGGVLVTFGYSLEEGRIKPPDEFRLGIQLKIEAILQQIVEENTNFKSITAFNDAENTTKEDVLKMIDLAIEKERACQTKTLI